MPQAIPSMVRMLRRLLWRSALYAWIPKSRITVTPALKPRPVRAEPLAAPDRLRHRYRQEPAIRSPQPPRMARSEDNRTPPSAGDMPVALRNPPQPLHPPPLQVTREML